MDGTPAGDGWNGYAWSNPSGAASVIQTAEIHDIETITITYISEGSGEGGSGTPTGVSYETVTLTPADFGDLELYSWNDYEERNVTVKGVNIEVVEDSGGDFWVDGEYISFYSDGEYLIRMADGSLITNIVLGSEYDIDDMPAGEGWSGYEWSSDQGAEVVRQTRGGSVFPIHLGHLHDRPDRDHSGHPGRL